MTREKTALPFDLQTAICMPAMLNHAFPRRRQRRGRSKIDLVRRPISKRLVRPLIVVELKIFRQDGRLAQIQPNILTDLKTAAS